LGNSPSQRDQHSVLSATLLLPERLNALGIACEREDSFKLTRQQLIQHRGLTGKKSACQNATRKADAVPAGD